MRLALPRRATPFNRPRPDGANGSIDIKQIRGWVEATGYSGMIEVEIFSQ